MGDIVKTAYIRRYPTGKCDFRFSLLLKSKNEEKVTKEIIVYANITDSLSLLVKTIKENVWQCLENNTENDKNEDEIDQRPESKTELFNGEISVVFMKDSKACRTDILIMEFITNMTKNGHQIYVQILQEKFKVIANAPLVRNLELPYVIIADYPVEPSKFHAVLSNKKDSKFCWYKSLDKKKWEKVGTEFNYEVKKDDVGYYLKLTCVLFGENNVKSPVVEVVSENKVEFLFEFPSCPFETRHKLTKTRLQGKCFRIVSYNVLSDRYAHHTQFHYCPLKALSIHYRKQLIVKELRGYNADIVALQEVDNQHFSNYYKKEFSDMGYKSLYHRKGNCIPEGLLCAFNKRRYKLLESKHIVFKMEFERRKQFSDLVYLLERNANVMKEFKAQNTSLQVTVLQDYRTKDVIIVGNTHLYYHPDADHIRLLQGFMSTTFLNSIKSRLSREYLNVGVVFCGDFNSHFRKSLYNFMIEGTVDPQHKDCLTISPNGNATIHHNFILESASGLPKYTNYTYEFKDCLDYIFTERNKFIVQRNIPVTSPETLEQYEGLPNEFFPSDHLALVVDLKIK